MKRDLGAPDYSCTTKPGPCWKTSCRHQFFGGLTCVVREANEHGALDQSVVAERLRVSPQAVQQCEVRALAKMRAALGDPDQWL